jgi:23S rRNA (pseudouridine1915-N3)-methyltransferase
VRIAIIAVGKVKQAGIRSELDDYLGRLKRYATTTEVELKDAPEKDLVPRFDKAIPTRTKVIALEVGGRMLDSHGLARLVADIEREPGSAAFLIGGAYGLPAEVSKKADLQLSLSPMTLPHRLARLFLAEQLYRAFTILRNEPYSH